MKKNYFIIGMLALSLFVISGIGWFLLFSKGEDDSSVTEQLRSLFPGINEGSSIQTSEQQRGLDAVVIADIPSDGPLQTLRKVYNKPTAGSIIFENNGELYIRFLEQGTGHVFEARATTTDMHRLTNTTIPRVREANWSADGEHVALRYLDEDLSTIQTFLARVTLPEDGQSGELAGTFWPENIKTIASFEDNFFYLQKNGDAFEGLEINTASDSATRLFTSTFGEWGTQYSSDGDLFLVSKPSLSVRGFLYTPTDSGVLIRILGDVLGLTALPSSDGTHVLFSASGNGTFSLHTFNRATQETTALSPRTLPEKCVWSRSNRSVIYCLVPKDVPRAPYPDAWYQGEVTFSDDVWQINVETNESLRVMNIEDTSREAVDGVNPMLSPEESYLIFTNKKDSSLWSLELPKNEETNSSEEET